MDRKSVLLFNTLCLYVKIILSGIVTLLSTRIILNLLGVNDFGLYNLVSGVVSMLSFLNGTLLVSTQRFLSVAMGEGASNQYLSKIFNVSVSIHLFLALILFFILLGLKPFLFLYILNIDPSSISVAQKIYDFMIVSSLATILSVPFNALINAHEDMWMFAIIESIVLVLKLISAFLLYIISCDLLITYSFFICMTIMLGCLGKYIWCRKRYVESKISFKQMHDFVLIKQQVGFVGWNTFGAIATLGRNQGIAIVLNLFFGTVLNAAYGVANQLNVLVSTFAATITTVFSPVIMKSKSNCEKMLQIAFFSSKISFLLSASIALPLLLELDNILLIWVVDVPDYSSALCEMTILSFVIMQLYPGITRAIYADGRMKWYQMLISLTILSTLPLGYFFLLMGYSPVSIVQIMLITQVCVMFETIFFAHFMLGLNVIRFFGYVLKSFLCFVSAYFLFIFFNGMLEMGGGLEICLSLVSVAFFISFYCWSVFSKEERRSLKLIFIRRKK